MNNIVTPQLNLQAAARQTMIDNGFSPDPPPAVQQQLNELESHPPALPAGKDVQDLRNLLWSSIDNDTSRDLDQVEVAQSLPNGETKILVGIADVDTFVSQGSPIDAFASQQTTTVYTGVHNFSMLPEALSTGLTSLLENQDRLAMVVEYIVATDGEMRATSVYRALIRNKAQLAYNSVGAWLEGKGSPPAKVAASPELQDQLRLQDRAAQCLKFARYRHGALNIETIETQPILLNDRIVDIAREQNNNATELIEEFMIAANEVVALMLDARKVSSIRRVVKTPERWPRIVQLAKQLGETLPAAPDSKALNDFLTKRKEADPDRFTDLSLAVIKLMGPGEYVLERPGDPEQGHFGLAVQDYTHSTAPNRRFADLVSQRLLKAVLSNQPAPYTDEALGAIARHCTLKEDAARKVERQMSKRISAVAMSGRIGEEFDALVTGVTPKGTFVRVTHPAIEGLLAQGQQGRDVGDKLRVRLIRTDVQRGYLDFAAVQNAGVRNN